MALVKIKGNNFRIFNGTATFVAETSCSVQIQGNMEDASDKDVAGAWRVEDMVEKQWSVQVEQKDAQLSYLRYIIGVFVNDTRAQIGWDSTDPDTPSVALEDGFSASGYAFLNDLVISANDREDIVVTSQWQGDGVLTN